MHTNFLYINIFFIDKCNTIINWRQQENLADTDLIHISSGKLSLCPFSNFVSMKIFLILINSQNDHIQPSCCLWDLYVFNIFMRNISNLFHYIFLWRLIHQFLFKLFKKTWYHLRNKKNVSFPQIYQKQIKNSPKDRRSWFIPAFFLLLYYLNKAYCLENNWNSHENLFWEQCSVIWLIRGDNQFVSLCWRVIWAVLFKQKLRCKKNLELQNPNIWKALCGLSN